MSISVTCDFCNTEYTVRDSAAGRSLRCTSCSEMISIPHSDGDVLDSLDAFHETDGFDESDEDWDDPPRRPKKSGKKRTQKSARSGAGSSGSVGEFVARHLTNAAGWQIWLALYAFALLLGCVVPNLWTILYAGCFAIGFCIFLAGEVFLFFAIITNNIWLIFLLPFVPFILIVLAHWGQEHTERPKRIIWTGVIVILCGFPPLLLDAPRPNNAGFANVAGNNNAPGVAPPPLAGQGGPGVAAAPGVGTPELFNVRDIPVPQFDDSRVARRTPQSGMAYFDVSTRSANTLPHPGSDMRLRLYLPREQAARRSLGCVLVGPAGSNLISGKPLDGPEHEDETVPYVRAGLAVVHFSLDGPIEDLQQASDQDMAQAYAKFRAAGAGLVNARNAMAYVIQHVPEVDPGRIYIAGHSSAGTLALLFAEHEPSLRGCIAYAPASAVPEYLTQLANDPRMSVLLPGIKPFVIQAAPITHVRTLSCPVFLFHGQGDENTPFGQSVTFVDTAKALGKEVTFSLVPDPHHYNAMAQKGVPLAIDWLRTRFQEPGGGVSPPLPSPAGNLPVPLPNNLVPPNSPISAMPPGAAPRPVAPDLNPPRPPNPGDRVVTLRFSAFNGKGDIVTAAQTALSGQPGVDASVLLVEQSQGKIVVLSQGNSLNSKRLSDSLKSAGFTMAPGVSMGAYKP